MHLLMSLLIIVDTDRGVQILLEDIDGTWYSLSLLISQYGRRKNFLPGSPLTMIIQADGIGILWEDVPKIQEYGSSRSLSNGLERVQI